MATSTPNNTSSSDRDCDSSQSSPCAKPPGFIGKRPWLFVIFAFGLMFSAWGVMIFMAVKHQPEAIPLVKSQAE